VCAMRPHDDIKRFGLISDAYANWSDVPWERLERGGLDDFPIRFALSILTIQYKKACETNDVADLDRRYYFTAHNLQICLEWLNVRTVSHNTDNWKPQQPHCPPAAPVKSFRLIPFKIIVVTTRYTIPVQSSSSYAKRRDVR